MERTDIRVIIGKNIRHRRTQADLSDDAFSAYLGIRLKRLQKYENGGDSPTCDELVDMAAILKCSVDDLCQGI